MILSVVFTRIIPARAGFTAQRACAGRRRRDHPRSRGVYLRGSGRLRPCAGSSPLARGLPHENRAAAGRSRIIPARAGFTARARRRSGRRRDHPRSRGVYRHALTPATNPSGSSPLARGLLVLTGPTGRSYRIIPARAGFTTEMNTKTDPYRDHPRSRGVYQPGWKMKASPRGSSPLARGLRPVGDRRPRSPGIIPARAGFTSARRF